MNGGTALFRNSAALERARLKPRRGIAEDATFPLANMWNRIGGLLTGFGREAGLAPAVALAVWMVECGGLPFARGRPVLRFEAHIFFNHWGKDNEPLFDAHFQFGGRNGIDGKRWEQQRFRHSPRADWQRFHGDQSTEYEVFRLAMKLAGREAACRSASFGGPQIMGFNHAVIGYGSAAEMFEDFARSERWQVCGFFDFCAAKDIVGTLKALDWNGFATVYNGPGNADAYAAKLAEAYDMASGLLERGTR